MDQATVTLLILGVMAILFVTDFVPLAVTSMLGAISLTLLGILPRDQLFSAFSGNTIVLLVSMMIIGSTLFHTGIAEKMSEGIVRVTGTSENGIILATVLVASIISSICSGVAVVAMLLPIVIGICLKTGVSVSRMMIPLAFSASFGGNLTLLGAASNVVVSGQMELLGVQPIGFLEIGKVGIPILIVGILYFTTIGKKFLTPGDHSDQEYLLEYMGKRSAEDRKELDVSKAVLSLGILAAVLLAMAWNNPAFPMHLVAAIGAVVMILTGCIGEQEAYRAVDWSSIFIVGGMSAVTKAMDLSGAGAWISSTAVNMLGEQPNKYLVLFVVLVLVAILTNLMMNTSTALLVTPLFIPIAQGLGMNPTAMGIAICVAASSPYLTPVGSGTNTLVVRPGNLKFMDFFRPGFGMTVVMLITEMIFIPLFWPL